MARLVKVPGIVIQASGVRAKATHITIQCRSCRTYQAGIAVKPGLEGYSLPRKCTTYVNRLYSQKVLPSLPPVLMGKIFYPVDFLSCVNRYIVPMVTFTAWVKIDSTKYFCYARIGGWGEILSGINF